MRIDQIKLLTESGNIKKVTVSPAVMKKNKWILCFERKNGEIVTLHAQRKNIREFANLESALRILNDLSIKKAEVDWS